ncbi:pyruvate ferredoxin oxidoreductase subunit gamma [Candidatus Bathyarchaeota archaeon]|nr:pyruvate ferredoxin oxidoreductase subunit gamma [Candidatus Bathyarchaeota archaeon]
MIEIRLHGRGGQGAVTASRLLATAAFLEDKHSQSIPMYGTERRGAPVTAFVRIGEKDKMVRSLIHEPDYVVVLDSLLRKTVNITEGLKDDGMLILNSSVPPEEIELLKPYKVATVDATGIALETLGRPITNTAILGAFVKATGEIGLESVIEAVKQQWKGTLGEINVKAVEAAYEATEVGDPKIVAEVVGEKAPAGSRADWRTFRPVVDLEKCTGCRLCWVYCPEHCIEMVDDKSVIDYAYCKGCGICVEECPVGAIEMKSESERGE